MSLWVVEHVAFSQAQETVQSFMQRLRPSIAVLGNLRHPTGMAALIDAQQGLFLAHADAVQGETVQARVGDGALVLSVLSRDARTSLVLLRTIAGNGPLAGPTLTLVDADPAGGAKVIVLFANDAVLGSFVGGGKMALRDTKSQAIPVSELRFENPPQVVSGALVFTLDGKLVGTMGATVSRIDHDAATMRSPLPIFPGAARSMLRKVDTSGPADLTVAYTPSLVLMRRVVGGFLSEDHRPKYAALGIQLETGPDGSARISRVFPDTPAGKAGVREGDILLGIGNLPIARQSDFVRAMLELEPGEKTKLHLRRKSADLQIEVVLARSKG